MSGECGEGKRFKKRRKKEEKKKIFFLYFSLNVQTK
jgi:hypothetical protein